MEATYEQLHTPAAHTNAKGHHAPSDPGQQIQNPHLPAPERNPRTPVFSTGFASHPCIEMLNYNESCAPAATNTGLVYAAAGCSRDKMSSALSGGETVFSAEF